MNRRRRIEGDNKPETKVNVGGLVATALSVGALGIVESVNSQDVISYLPPPFDVILGGAVVGVLSYVAMFFAPHTKMEPRPQMHIEDRPDRPGRPVSR